MNTYRSVFWRAGQLLIILTILAGILGAPSLGAAMPQAGTIQVDPASGAPGSRALVSGSFDGFGAYDAVTLWWNNISDGYNLGTVTLRDDGSFVLPIVIPPDTSIGTHKIIADVNWGYDQAEADFEVTQAQYAAAYIYHQDLQTATAFKNLLDGNGVNTTLIQLESVSGTNFSTYNLILIGHDTGSGYDWAGSSSAVQQLQGSGKPILGLGLGGSAFFQQLDLHIRYGNSWQASNQTDLYAFDRQDPIWKTPYRLYVPANQALTIYNQGSSTRAVYLPTSPLSVLEVARQSGNVDHYPLAQEEGRYFLWGFYDGPASMTAIGRHLLLNAAFRLIWIFDVDTLILTDYDRMENLGYAHSDVSGLENDINNLRGLPKTTTNMTAIWRDISDHTLGDTAADCAGWDADEGDVSDTNTCVEAIDDYIELLKSSSYPNLSYVIFIGTSEVIPMKAREQDHLISAQEKSWGAGLPASGYIKDLYSDPGAVNGWGHYLTDSIYGDLSYVNDGWGSDHELIPELAVGRMVETPAQIRDQIDVFINNNAYFARGDRVSVASDDYVDGGTLATDYMGFGTDDSLVAGSFASTDVPPVLNAGNDLVYFGGHGNYNAISTGSSSFMAGNHATRGDTNDLNDMPNAVIVTSGCHNGASFGNQLFHAPDAGTTYSEFPEEFGDKQVGVYVGATGYTIISGTGSDTDVSQVRHNEKLSTYVVQHLDQDGCISAGEAFRRAVNSYVTDVGSIGTTERRVISITTLYGIPNYRGSCLIAIIPRIYDYWLRPIWLDPPPVFDPGIFRLRVELEIRDWMIEYPGGGPEWFLNIAGAQYGGTATQPLMPLVKTGVILPPGSTIEGVEWDQAVSEHTSWVAKGSMYVPLTTEDPERIKPVESNSQEPITFDYPHAFPELPYKPYSTTTAGGAGIMAGLGVIPLQYNPKTGDTTLWNKLAFTLTLQTQGGTDADGDGLPTFWEGSHGLNPNDGGGDHGGDGNPDRDGLTNLQELAKGTSPVDPDTDNDGWLDGKEVEIGTDPLNPGSIPSVIFLPTLLR